MSARVRQTAGEYAGAEANHEAPASTATVRVIVLGEGYSKAVSLTEKEARRLNLWIEPSVQCVATLEELEADRVNAALRKAGDQP